MAQIKIYLNDEEKEVPEASTLLQVLEEWKLSVRKGIAVVLNGEVVPRAEWKERILKEGDRIQVIAAFQGG
jgi:sulfur carrier protein